MVAYAAVRGIDVIPEIDMPGHCLQAIDSYPWLACFGRGSWGQSFSSPLCVGKDRTLAFCESVWEELSNFSPMNMFTWVATRSIRATGNVVPTVRPVCVPKGCLTKRLFRRGSCTVCSAFCEARGRRMIGWDEILEGGAVPGATVMWWRPWEPQSVSAATRQGCEVVLCPQSWFYFSLEEDANSLARICRFDMLPDSLSDAQKRQIKGVQGNLWTEKIPTWSRAEYMFYPRLLVLAEKGWTEPGKFDEDAFMSRLLDYCRRLDDEGVNYRIPSLTNYHAVSVFTDSVRTAVVCPLPGAVLRYTLDGSVPTVNSPRYDAPLVIRDDCMLHIRPYHADGRTGDWITVRYEKQDYARPLEPRDTEPGLCVDWYFRRFPGCDAIGIPETLYAAGGRCVVDSVCFPRAAAGRRAVGMIFRGISTFRQPGSIPLRSLPTTAPSCVSAAGWWLITTENILCSKRADRLRCLRACIRSNCAISITTAARFVLSCSATTVPATRSIPTCSATIREDCIFRFKVV